MLTCPAQPCERMLSAPGLQQLCTSACAVVIWQVDDPYADVALPKNYPKEWKDAAATAYAGVVEEVEKQDGLQNGSHQPPGEANGTGRGTAHGDGGLDHAPSSHVRCLKCRTAHALQPCCDMHVNASIMGHGQ